MLRGRASPSFVPDGPKRWAKSAPLIHVGHNWTSRGSVNVTSYDDSVWADEETIATFKAVDPRTTAGRIGSMGTTHGMIRELSAPAKFLFVSGITDAVPRLNSTVASLFLSTYRAGPRLHAA